MSKCTWIIERYLSVYGFVFFNGVRYIAILMEVKILLNSMDTHIPGIPEVAVVE